MDTRIKAVIFDEENHKYFYNGVELHGVTGAIGKAMGKNFPDTNTVKIAAMYGSDVHKDVENYFNQHGFRFNDTELSSESARWVVEELKDFCSNVSVSGIECEVMVSDFIGTASKVDVVVRSKDNRAWLFDIKTTSTFDRPYCSLQLSIYKKLFEDNYGMKVEGLYVLATKIKRKFKILEQEESKIQKLLDMNKAI